MKMFNKNRFAFAALTLGCVGVMLSACGDDSSSAEEPVSDIFSLEKSFEIVLDKADYKYNKKDSSFKIIKPVCETRTLGYLVGPDSAPEWDTLSYRAYVNKGTISLKDTSDTQKFSTSDTTFPVGLWIDPETESLKIQQGYNVSKTQMNSVFRYTGSCFMKDFFGQFRKENPALEEADSVLTAFYNKFKSSSDTSVNEKQMISDIRVNNCDELTIFDALVSVKLSEFRASSGKLTVAYDTLSCPITFNLRYAYNQSDCEAAFADFEDDRNAAKEFDFDNYWKSVDYDEYCIAQVVLNLKRAKKIPLKASAEDSGDFAKALVDVVVGGLK